MTTYHSYAVSKWAQAPDGSWRPKITNEIMGLVGISVVDDTGTPVPQITTDLGVVVHISGANAEQVETVNSLTDTFIMPPEWVDEESFDAPEP